MNTNKEMNNFKIGDRVKVVFVPDLSGEDKVKITIGMTGTVKDLTESCAGVEFDDYINGNGGVCGFWEGKYGHCCCVLRKDLEKIEEAKGEVEEMDIAEETKTFEQKILEVLREEIGVAEGEEFDVYKKGNMLWRCKFERDRFFCKGHYEFQKAEVWKNIIANFHEYTFKRKPFIPDYEEKYVFLFLIYDRNNNIKVDVATTKWVGNIMNYGMLALGNVFRSKIEALENNGKLLEKIKKLQKGEV